MTPLATQPVLEETRLENAWFAIAVADIRSLQNVGKNVPGVGDYRVNDAIASRARMLLSQISITELPYPAINVFSGGGISLTWNLGQKELSFSVLPDGQIYFMQEERGNVIRDAFIEDLGSVDNLAKWLVMREAYGTARG